MRLAFGAVSIALAVLFIESAMAAEIKVLSVAPLKTSLETLTPEFERATGHKLAITYEGSGAIKRRLESGEIYDLAIIYPPLIDDLIKVGKVMAEPRAEVARAAVGIAVKNGAPKPDISTTDALKRTLLNAKTISHSAEGASGIYLNNLLERLGIAGEVKPKLRPVDGGPRVVGPVAKGDVELAVISVPFILIEPGAELVGALPVEFQQYTSYTAGISKGAAEAEAGRALIKFLTTPAAALVYKSNGLEAGTER